MMRAWENRPDTAVVDEPLYAHYLAATGLDHPGREEIIAAGESDWRKVVACLTGPAPGGRPIFYQKHMTHHFLPDMDDAWLAQLSHAFLIRDPREVLLSYIRTRPSVTVEDIGVPQQWKIYERVRELTGVAPVVIDAGEFLRHPQLHLTAWCSVLGIGFTDRMLSWPRGPRATDGVWAPFWYESVLRSTGFEPWRERDRQVPAAYRQVVDACMPIYEQLCSLRLRVNE